MSLSVKQLQEQQRIRDLRAAGMGFIEIAEKVGLSTEQTYLAWTTDNHDDTDKLDAIRDQEIIDAMPFGSTIRQVAKVSGHSVYHVKRVMDAFDVAPTLKPNTGKKKETTVKAVAAKKDAIVVTYTQAVKQEFESDADLNEFMAAINWDEVRNLSVMREA